MAYLLLTLTTLFWSGNFVLSRGMHADIPPLSLSFWRWGVALLILLCFGGHHLWRQREVAKKHSVFILIQGLLGVAGFNSLIYIAVQTTTAINAVLVNSCIPVLIAIFSWILHKDMMTPRQCLGVLISLGGVVLIIARGEIDHILTMNFNRGDLLVLVAASLWALYSTNLRNYPKDLHPLAYLTGIIISGLFMIFPFYLVEIYSGRYMAITPSSIATVLYVAIFASLLAFIFWNRAVRIVGANKAGPFIHLMPAFSTILAVFFLGEKLHPYHIQGILLIFFGILMTTFMIRQR
ncbi:MAG: DMT family transporter [Deltaproteobacteria bacterium]|nr:DMT family transporter [Deltaproteobacteria bacterium]